MSVGKFRDTLVLIEKSVSQWVPRKKDKDATHRTAMDEGAEEDRLSVTKKLTAKEATERYEKASRACDQYLDSVSVPWSKGIRVAKVDRIQEIHAKVTEFKNEWQVAVTEFLGEYPRHRLEGLAALGSKGMANPDDYPLESEIASKFNWTFRAFEIPDVQDIRIQANDEITDLVRESTRQALEEGFKMATGKVWEQIHSVTKKMCETLRSGGKKYHGTLVTNIRDLVKSMSAINVTNDPAIIQIASQLDAELCQFDVDTLKSSEVLSRQIADKAAAIAAHASQFAF